MLHDALADVEQAEADTLAAAARRMALAPLTASTLAVATLVVADVLKDPQRASLGQISAEMRAIRSNPKLQGALLADIAQAVIQVRDLMVRSLHRGYDTDLHKRSEITQIQSTGLHFEIAVTQDELDNLSGYAVVGHSCQEHADYLGQRLQFDVEGALTLPLVGTYDPSTLPAQLGQVESKHADRVATLVEEAYFAGVSAATVALRQALTGGAA